MGREVTAFLLCWNRKNREDWIFQGKKELNILEIGIYPFIYKNEEGLGDFIYSLFHNFCVIIPAF